MASPTAPRAPDRRDQLVLYGIGFAALTSAALALLVRLPEGAGFGLSLSLHGPRLLMALAAGAGFGVAGAFHAAEDDRGRGHPLLLALAAGAALGAGRGSDVSGLSPLLDGVVGAAECAAVFLALAFGARFLGSWSRLATGVVMVGLLAVGAVATLEAKGDPAGARPWVFWLLGDVSYATWATALPVSVAIAGLSWALVRHAPAGADLASLSDAERRALLGTAGLLFGLCLGAVGGIAFFALIVALAARQILGHERLRPWALLGGCLGAFAMVWADALPRALFGGFGPPTGFAVAAVAVPWFLLRNGGESSRVARAAEVLLGLFLVIAVGGGLALLFTLARQLA